MQINGSAAACISRGSTIDRIAAIPDDSLPVGYDNEWSGETYQALMAGNQPPIILAFGLVVVFLVLAAQYERCTHPIVVLLAVLGAYIAVSWRGLAQDI